MSSLLPSSIATAAATTDTTGSGSISRTAHAFATSLPTAPAILANPASLSFNESIFIVIYVLTGLTAITLAVAVAALATQLVRKEQRRLVQKTTRSEGVYFLPHSPILAPVMVICYATVGLATCIVLKAFLWQGSAVAVIQRLSLLLPMPMLIFAWLSACANAFAWHLTPLGNSKFQHRLRLRPMTLNLITWLMPIFIFAVNLVLVIIWPMLQADAKALKVQLSMSESSQMSAKGTSADVTPSLARLEAILPDDDPQLDQLTLRYTRKLRQSEGIYQAVWAVWALAYGVCWMIYTAYSSLLIALLGRQMKFISSTSVVTDPQHAQSSVGGQSQSTPSEARETRTQNSDQVQQSRREPSGDRKSMRGSVRGSVKRRSTNTLKFIASVGPEMRYISKRELLRRNTRLVIMELVAFSIFTVAWWILSITKAAMGYRILTNHITGPLTVIGELFESTLFGLVVVSLLLVRGVNILRNRREQISHGVTSTTSQEQTESYAAEGAEEGNEKNEAIDGDTPPPASRRPNLATRRGKSLLAINLGAGTYFIPATGSAATTPILEFPPSRRGSAPAGVEGMVEGPSTQHLLGYSSSPSSATSSAQAGSTPIVTPFSPYGPVSPTSEKLAELNQQTRRKSSVTFADGLASMATSPHRSPAVHTPTLEVITASPFLGGGRRLSLQDALASNLSEATRSLETEQNILEDDDELEVKHNNTS